MAEEATVPIATWFEPDAARLGIRPLIKMPGSKRWLARAMRSGMDGFLKQGDGTLYEPFAGSAVIALTAGALGHTLVVSDASPELTTILIAARDDPDGLWERLLTLVESGISKDRYLEVRSKQPEDTAHLAAWSLYLARLSFNGLWRVNSQGHFNVPYGRNHTRAFPSLNAIRAVSAALSQAEIYQVDFRAIVHRLQPGDLVYFDPPYTDTFTGFGKAGWKGSDASTLADCARTVAERGVAVVVSSPSDDQTASAYRSWAYMTIVPKRHNVAAKAVNRKSYAEAIYTNRPDLIDLTKTGDSTKEENTENGGEEPTSEE